MTKRWYHLLLSGFLLSMLAQAGFAKTIPLYEQPENNAKVVGSVDTSVGIISIFAPEKSAWVKVADPRNGNVGWIKSSEVGEQGFSYNMLRTKDGGQKIEMIQQQGSTKPYSPKHLDKTLEEIKVQQKKVQENIESMLKVMSEEMQRQWSVANQAAEQPTPAPKATQPAKHPQPLSKPQQ